MSPDLLTSCKRLWLSLLLLAVTVACKPPDAPSQIDVTAWRAEKDRFMRSDESPVPEAQRPAFPPLPYFDIAPRYHVPAALTVARGDQIIELSTSTGQRRRMRKIGTLRFTLEERPLTLTAFADADTQDVRRLFVPFGDLTNGNETYAGGRYLDLDRTATGIYDLDFNRAYQPFCVFNTSYECPYPPRENRLKVAIRAGERFAPKRGS